MMTATRRQFSRAYKLEAVRLITEDGRTPGEVARELGVRADMLRRWKREVDAWSAPAAVFPGQGNGVGLEEELRRLRRENEVLRQEREILKKRRLISRQGTAVKFRFIRTHGRAYPISLLCRVLHVSRSGYYAWVKKAASGAQEPRGVGETRLRLEVRAAYRKSGGTYGSPRVHRELREGGIRCGKKRVERIMRQEGLRATPPQRSHPKTTDSAHALPVAPNRLARRFSVAEAGGVNRVWVGDITYVPTGEGWLYLAVVLDLGSRRVVGWAMQESLEGSLTLAALRMAVEQRRPAPGVLLHSDRGSQYAAYPYQALLHRHGMQCSMSRTGDCLDNAAAESFFATLEKELITRNRWQTRREAQAALFWWIEGWYNRERRHSSLAYKSPAEYEEQLALIWRAA